MYGVHRICAETAAVSCGTSHASAVNTPLRWTFKKRTIKLVTHVEPHVSAVSLLKRVENRVFYWNFPVTSFVSKRSYISQFSE